MSGPAFEYRLYQILRNEHQGKEPFFDLAKLESTYPDGTRFTEKDDGKEIDSIINGYTFDYGHLNAFGRKWVAENLLIFLMTL